MYAALYQGNGSGSISRLMDDMVIKPEKLFQILKKRNEALIFIGDAVPKFSFLMKEFFPELSLFAPSHLSLTTAYNIALIAFEEAQRGKKPLDIKSIVPKYIRRPEAEIKRREAMSSQ